MPATGVESDPLLWKAIAGALSMIVAAFGYFIRKRDEKIEENTKEVISLRNEVLVLKTHMELYSQEQTELRENVKGIVDCVQEIRIGMAGLPCSSGCTKKK